MHILARGCAPLCVSVGLLGFGCGKGQSDVGQATGAAVHDTELMRAAAAAVNEAVRSGSDCGEAKPLADEAQRKLDELRPQVRTPTGRAALDSLRAQLEHVQQACP